ncbi:glucose transporter [Micractinium conductrix]|uniref:Glucose transporter n=1 Tax=Micractinium conductrix TaxID=554055 RepID=A0A2P6VKW9_9CHLO|nr:glucose transporter [Micractinium conductrix]|eukprot:PSC74729.1 glucose transporter [Micractinium conductrix]
MIATGAAFLSVSWIAVPFLLAIFGLPALWAGGMAAGVFATIAGGALLLPSLFNLVLIGGGLWVGATVAQRLFYGGGTGEPTVGPNGTIDVEADTVEDWRDEVSKEQREREAELREFDDLLRRRDEFKKGGGPRY